MIFEIRDFVMKKINGKREIVPTPCLLKPYELEDVIAIRDDDLGLERATNVPWTFGDWHTDNGFEWGYCGMGPLNLAVNILMHFSEHDVEFSKRHQREFAEQFVFNLPRPGGRIRKEDILGFIGEKRSAG